ncbi:MAG: acetylxylan esterase [Planctomycetota bacterium]|jgi:cephalosporin-C deacetylase|nr:acetylxylan esterase [Planctomycetota bacterium]
MQIIHEGQRPRWGHDFPFDPTQGYDRDALLACRAPASPPADFDAFWQATYRSNEAIPLRYELHDDQAAAAAGRRVYRVSYQSWGERTSWAWLVEPAQALVMGCVIGHGYGGRDGCDIGRQALTGRDDVVRMYPVARGFDISAMDDIPNHASGHVVHGIASRDDYVIRGCVAELWTCSRILLDRYPRLAGRLVYAGGSFGGGLGALMLPWCERYVAAHLDVPTFGDQALRARCVSTGSAEAVQAYYRAHPEVLEVLAYYDAATAATRITVPVLAAAALFDPSVPPPGQFAVVNSLAGPTDVFISSMGHFQHPDVAAEAPALAAAVTAFLRRHALGAE